MATTGLGDVSFATAEDIQADVAQHDRTYANFIALMGWFAVHAVIDVGGIVALITGHTILGVLLLTVGTAVLAQAILKVLRHADQDRRNVRRNSSK